MSVLGAFIKVYLEAGGVLLFAFACFVGYRHLGEQGGARFSPSILIRIAQTLLVGSFAISLFTHVVPERQRSVAPFEFRTGAGDRMQPLVNEVSGSTVQPLPIRHTPNVKLNPMGAMKQRLLDFIESSSGHSASFVFLAFLLSGWTVMTNRLRRQSGLLQTFLAKSLLIRRIGRVRILVNDEITIPFSTLQNKIAYVVVPASLAMNYDDFKLAIYHELQHHRRRDTAWARVIEIAIGFYFWNPAVYLWKSEIIELQELACDEALIGQRRVSTHKYGSCLLKVAEAALVHQDMRIGTVCMGLMSKKPNRHVSFLRRRIDMFPSHKGLKQRNALGLALGTASLFLTAAVAYGAQQTFKSEELMAPNPGDIHFDPEIQRISETALAKYVKKFNAKAGFVLVSEVSTGRLLAVANLSDDSTLAKNWALSYEVEPASAMKVPLVATALEDGVTSPDETHDCGNGIATIGHGTYRDYKSFDRLTTADSVVQSSNICSIRVALKLGSGGVARSMSDFGFGIGGTTTGFPQSRAGEIPDPSLYAADDFVSVVTIGYSGVPRLHVTPLEMVHAIGAIANDGRLMKPLAFDAADSSIEVVRQSISERTANEMKAILRRVVTDGTGRPAKSAIYTTAGKTSSAFAPSSGHHNETGGERAMAGFVGFAPLNDPKLAVYVGIFEPHDKNDPNAHGARHAAPVFREVIEQALKHLNVAPDATSEVK